jgi:hypothetical protein
LASASRSTSAEEVPTLEHRTNNTQNRLRIVTLRNGQLATITADCS